MNVDETSMSIDGGVIISSDIVDGNVNDVVDTKPGASMRIRPIEAHEVSSDDEDKESNENKESDEDESSNDDMDSDEDQNSDEGKLEEEEEEEEEEMKKKSRDKLWSVNTSRRASTRWVTDLWQEVSKSIEGANGKSDGRAAANDDGSPDDIEANNGKGRRSRRAHNGAQTITEVETRTGAASTSKWI